jgi:hypothetical protein
MANHCYNHASIEGSKKMLDLFEKRLAEATKYQEHLWWETFHHLLGKSLGEGVSYEEFGSRWFNPFWERHSATSGVLSGDSAWSPVSEFFRKLSEVYQLEIQSEYEECGSDFGGWFDCINGKVTRDKTVSYKAYRFIEEDTEFFYSLIEDAEEGSYDSIDEMNEDFLSLLSETQKQEIIDAIEKYKATQK